MPKLLFLILFLLSFFFQHIFAQVSAAFEHRTQKDFYCNYDTISFINLSENYDYIHWDFGDGYETYIENPKHLYTQAGNYTVRLTAYQTGGASADTSLELSIEQAPEMSLEPQGLQYLDEGSVLEARVSGNFNSVQWSTGSSAESIEITVGGTYRVQVFADNGCTLSDSLRVETVKVPESEIRIEITNNILTPDGNGLNDFLIISDFDKILGRCNLKVFNRHGALVFENSDYKNNWRGTDLNGRLLDSGTYYYIIKIEGRTGGTGFIDIIR